MEHGWNPLVVRAARTPLQSRYQRLNPPKVDRGTTDRDWSQRTRIALRSCSIRGRYSNARAPTYARAPVRTDTSNCGKGFIPRVAYWTTITAVTMIAVQLIA